MLYDVVNDVAMEIHRVNHNVQPLNARRIYRGARKSSDLVRVVVLLPPDVVRAIDNWGLARGASTRTAALKRIIDVALQTEKASDQPASNSDASTTTV